MGVSEQFTISHTLPLSQRETQVLQAIAQGHSNKQVAKMLLISPNTVAGYLKEVYRKLGVRNRTAATLVAMANGLLNESFQVPHPT